MVVVLVVALLIAAALVAVCSAIVWRARRRRRQAVTMFVTTYPGIELEQPYGPWDADAYDAGTHPVRLTAPLRIQPGTPSRWARVL